MLLRELVCTVLLVVSLPATAAGLREAFEAAVSLNPEVTTLQGQRAEIEARRGGADSLLPGPASVGAGYLTDELTEKDGYGDLEVELGAPVWLPGQARAQRALADAELARLAAEIAQARLAVAAEVREAYWAWALADASLQAARSAAEAAASLARDSDRQLRAGQIAPVDDLLASADARQAEVGQREAELALRKAAIAFRALTGSEPPRDVEEPLRPVAEARHPRIEAARLEQDVGRASLRLADAENRESPEIALVYQRERDASGEPWDDRVGIRLRFPFAYASRNAERRAAALNEAGTAAAEQVAAERAIAGELETARAVLEGARTAQGLAEQRYTVLAEAAALADQALASGQASLLETLRLRASLASADAGRRRAAVALRQAISRINQAQGYEP